MSKKDVLFYILRFGTVLQRQVCKELKVSRRDCMDAILKLRKMKVVSLLTDSDGDVFVSVTDFGKRVAKRYVSQEKRVAAKARRVAGELDDGVEVVGSVEDDSYVEESYERDDGVRVLYGDEDNDESSDETYRGVELSRDAETVRDLCRVKGWDDWDND